MAALQRRYRKKLINVSVAKKQYVSLRSPSLLGVPRESHSRAGGITGSNEIHLSGMRQAINA